MRPFSGLASLPKAPALFGALDTQTLTSPQCALSGCASGLSLCLECPSTLSPSDKLSSPLKIYFRCQFLQESLSGPQWYPPWGSYSTWGLFPIRALTTLVLIVPFPVCLSLWTARSLRAGTAPDLALHGLPNP